VKSDFHVSTIREFFAQTCYSINSQTNSVCHYRSNNADPSCCTNKG